MEIEQVILYQVIMTLLLIDFALENQMDPNEADIFIFFVFLIHKDLHITTFAIYLFGYSHKQIRIFQ